ncbi:T-box protein H15-like [Artemia franciscana]|uniref:T-box protein H15-like n=1 Tax=Artemia franciscana TaxID=6661 RepID=UPI0032DBAEDB
MLCQLRTLSNMSEKLKTDFSIAAIIGNDVPAEKRKPEAYDLNEHKSKRLKSSPPPSPRSSRSVTPSSLSERTISPVPSEDENKSKTPVKSLLVGECTCEDLNSVECHLETHELWEKFNELGTEMIITKTGRRMFPTVRVAFTGPGMKSSERYAVLLDVAPSDNKRYRYAYHRSSWLIAGKADPPVRQKLYSHPDCPMTGDQLRKQIISFEKVKLTNNDLDKVGHIVLNSMHRYQPRVHLVKLKHGQTHPPTALEGEDYRTYLFPETTFTAVTAYQNQLITKLKIDSNPFAKGFRDSTRLSEYDRDTIEIDSHYLRNPALRLHPDPEIDAILTERARAASLSTMFFQGRPEAHAAQLLAIRNQQILAQWSAIQGLSSFSNSMTNPVLRPQYDPRLLSIVMGTNPSMYVDSKPKI